VDNLAGQCIALTHRLFEGHLTQEEFSRLILEVNGRQLRLFHTTTSSTFPRLTGRYQGGPRKGERRRPAGADQRPNTAKRSEDINKRERAKISENIKQFEQAKKAR